MENLSTFEFFENFLGFKETLLHKSSCLQREYWWRMVQYLDLRILYSYLVWFLLLFFLLSLLLEFDSKLLLSQEEGCSEFKWVVSSGIHLWCLSFGCPQFHRQFRSKSITNGNYSFHAEICIRSNVIPQFRKEAVMRPMILKILSKLDELLKVILFLFKCISTTTLLFWIWQVFSSISRMCILCCTFNGRWCTIGFLPI